MRDEGIAGPAWPDARASYLIPRASTYGSTRIFDWAWAPLLQVPQKQKTRRPPPTVRASMASQVPPAPLKLFAKRQILHENSCRATGGFEGGQVGFEF